MRIKSDDRGMSLVELIVVIAIMAVMLGAGGFAMTMLSGAEAKQAASKLSAQLNDVKTGAMSRAGEEMELRYIGETDLSDEKGFSKTGFYAIKTMSTITDAANPVIAVTKDGTTKTAADTESDRIASGKVTITLTIESNGSTVDKVLSSSSNTGDLNSVVISYDRSTGRLNPVKDAVGNELGTLSKITFKCGAKTIEMDFISESGKHEIVQ